LGGAVEFSGSVRELFWRFFDPDFRKVVTDQIEQTLEDFEDVPDLVEPALNETRELLRDFVCRAYDRLAEIDQHLRGKGYPNSVARKPVQGMIQRMHKMLDELVDGAIQSAALKRWGHVLLQPEQKEVLVTMDEAVRNAPPHHRQSIRVVQDRKEYFLDHPGFRGGMQPVDFHDLEVLSSTGLIELKAGSVSTVWSINISPKGSSYCVHLRRGMAQPMQRIEARVKQYIDSAHFKRNHPEAYRKWLEAEELLWSADSQKQFTTIGHHCREAMQEFADALTTRHNPPNVEPDKMKTVARVRSVLNVYSQKLGDKEKAFLDALVPYWGTVADLTQRQEHGAQKEGESLILEDARRVVFQTLLVMFEIDRALSRVSS
jgi:hypothetical protein